MRIKLVCDSLCDIPQEIMDKEYVEIVPLTVVFDCKEYKEGIDMKEEEFYTMLKNSSEIPKTSQATYMDFKNRFDKFLEEGCDIICLTGAAKSSGTYQSAMLAKSDCGVDNISVFDTNNLSLGSGQFVIKACELIEEGLDLEEIVKGLESIRSSTKLIFMPFTLKYLEKSGRVSIATALIGNMLSMKPVFFFDNAEGKLLAKIRGTKHIASKLVDAILELCKDYNTEKMIFTIGCGDNLEYVKKIEKELKSRIKFRKLHYTRGGVAICCHTGPDILAISCSY